MLPIKEHEIKIIESEGHKIEFELKPNFRCNYTTEKNFSFLYCVAYRHPSLPEWILARGYWNDEGIWTPEGLWYDQ